MEDTADVLRLKRRAAREEGGSRVGEREVDPSEERRRAWAVGVGRCETPRQMC
jgi:hypothetical protein